MPTSIDPPLRDDEIECARCGARFYYELTRCPNCGVNLYEPDEEGGAPAAGRGNSSTLPKNKLGARLDGFIRRLTKKPYAIDELFGAAINQAELFNALLGKVGGDRAVAERLVDLEKAQFPQGNRIVWIERAIQHWEQDNQTSGST
jgi:hypothetical protein